MTNTVETMILLATLLWHEARGECWEGKRAVASVVCNESALTGGALNDVICNPRRYSCWRKNKPGVIPFCRNATEERAWRECLDVAYNALTQTIQRYPFTHYWRYDIQEQPWMRRIRDKQRIGDHIFGVGEI